MEVPAVTTAPTPPPQGYWNGDGVPGAPKIVVSISEQRAYFYKGKNLVGESTVSTGKPGFGTPPGSYTVLWKHADHVSSVFGDYVDDFGNVTKSNIDVRKDSKPPGSHYDGARMPFAMFFRSGYAMHQGYVPPFAASHGCIRLPQGMAETFFNAAQVGTPVIVKQEAVMRTVPLPPVVPPPPAPYPATTTVAPPPQTTVVRSNNPAAVRPGPVRYNATVPSPTPMPLRSPAPVRSSRSAALRSPTPLPLRSPTPVPLRSPAPVLTRTTGPLRSPTPLPLRSPSPGPVRTLAPAPLRSPTPVPLVRAPGPLRSRGPVPMHSPTPAPLQTVAPFPLRSPAPSSVRPSPTPVPSRKKGPVSSKASGRLPAPTPTPTPTPRRR